MSSKGEKDYAVGKGKAPASGRWKKGQSGNPAGRKKKASVESQADEMYRPLEKHLAAELSQLVPVTQNGETVMIPAGKAMAKKLTQMSLGAKNLAEMKIVADMLAKLRVSEMQDELHKDERQRRAEQSRLDYENSRAELMALEKTIYEEILAAGCCGSCGQPWYRDEDSDNADGDVTANENADIQLVDDDDPSTDGAISSEASDSVD